MPTSDERGSDKRFAKEALDHVDAVHRLARYLTGNPSAAEDLVQETYARALGHSEKFAEGTHLRAWLLRIARNAFIDSYRKDLRENARGTDYDIDIEELVDDSHEPLRGDGEMDRLRTVVARDIEAALMTLSPDARTMIVLALDGMSEDELATVMGCARGTVKSRLSRARDILRAKLSDYARGK